MLATFFLNAALFLQRTDSRRTEYLELSTKCEFGSLSRLRTCTEQCECESEKILCAFLLTDQYLTLSNANHKETFNIFVNQKFNLCFKRFSLCSI